MLLGYGHERAGTLHYLLMKAAEDARFPAPTACLPLTSSCASAVRTWCCRSWNGSLQAKVPQVKFVDRTLTAKKSHAMAIWQYIRDHDNGITNFHFEIAADLLDKDELDPLSTMRPGLVQLEIGVQSTKWKKHWRRSAENGYRERSARSQQPSTAGKISTSIWSDRRTSWEDIESFKKSF